MKRLSLTSLLTAVAVALVIGAPAISAEDQGRAFELRTYYAAEGKFDDLQARFRDHTLRIFAKHGMDVVGFWTPTDEEGSTNTLVYMLAFPSQEARGASWQAFVADPEWKKVAEESQKDGRLVTKIDSLMLAPTDYSPLK